MPTAMLGTLPELNSGSIWRNLLQFIYTTLLRIGISGDRLGENSGFYGSEILTPWTDSFFKMFSVMYHRYQRLNSCDQTYSTTQDDLYQCVCIILQWSMITHSAALKFEYEPFLMWFESHLASPVSEGNPIICFLDYEGFSLSLNQFPS